MTAKSSKRHHYLPQFYLEGFCDDGSFWVYDRPRQSFRRQTPINTAVQTHFYSTKQEDGSIDTSLESLLADVESLSSPIIKSLNEGETPDQNSKITLSVFLALQVFRVPEFQRRQSDLRRAILDKLEGNVAPPTQEEIDAAPSVIPREEAGPRVSAYELVENLRALENDSDLAQDDFVRTVPNLASEVADLLVRMSWSIQHAASGSEFITTDAPFTTIPPLDFDPSGQRGYGMATPGATKLMPLSRKSCLFIHDQGRLVLHRQMERRAVNELNRILAMSCHDYIISSSEQRLRMVVSQSGVDDRPDHPRIKIN